MTIEEPEHPRHFPDVELAIQAEYHTIGEFYTAVGELMAQLGEGVFTHDISRQVTGWIDQNQLRSVVNLKDALEAIELIVEQGEGTQQSPEDKSHELAHYYRFEQIQREETLNRDPEVPAGCEWGPPTIGLDDTGVWPMILNPTEVPLPPGSEVARVSDQFDGTYTLLIDELQRTFNGEPAALGSAMAQMHALRIEAARLMPMEVPGHKGPRDRGFCTWTTSPGARSLGFEPGRRLAGVRSCASASRWFVGSNEKIPALYARGMSTRDRKFARQQEVT